MTIPFGQFIESTDSIDGGGVQSGGGTVGVSTTSGGGTGGTTTTTTGVCQADGDCQTGYFCDTSNPTFGEDLTNPFGVCKLIPITYCNYTDFTGTCESILGVGYEGTATKTDLVTNVAGSPLPLGCTPDARIDTSWNTGECIKVAAPVCAYIEEEIQCNSLEGFSEYTGIASRRALQKDSDGNSLPLGCVTDPNVNTQWNTSGCEPPNVGCTAPDGPFEQVITRSCVSIDPVNYNTGTAEITQTRTYIEGSSATSEVCPYTNWVDDSVDTSNCTFIEDSCSPPSGPFTQVVDVECTAISSNFISGTAKQVQTREYTVNSSAGTVCPYTDWSNSGAPDTSFCQVINNPTTCTAPSGPFTQQISIPCSQVDAKYTKGDATQTQVRRYDASVDGPGMCPYTEWENYGAPNTATCEQPVFWRDCITGDLVEGNAPSNYRQVNFSKGGTCWEPASELGFRPSLSEALKYRYQRGSSQLPESKTINISNTSYTLSYAVTITTNSSIVLSVDGMPNGKGTIVFTVPPRAEKALTVVVGQELLQQLQDGLSTLSMTVDYEQIVS